MNKLKKEKFNKFVTLGWWLSFIFFAAQSIIITLFDLPAIPIVGLVFFASFVVLSFSSHYDQEGEFSPYKGIKNLFQKRNVK